MKRLLYLPACLLLLSLSSFVGAKEVKSDTGYIAQDAAGNNNEAACVQMVMECDHITKYKLAHPLYNPFRSTGAPGNPTAQNALQSEITAGGTITPGPKEIVNELNDFDVQGYYAPIAKVDPLTGKPDPDRTVGTIIGYMTGYHRPALFWTSNGSYWIVVTSIKYNETTVAGIPKYIPKAVTLWDPFPTPKSPVQFTFGYSTFKTLFWTPVNQPGGPYDGKYVAITDPEAPAQDVLALPPLGLCDRLLYAEEAIAAAAIAISDLGLDTEPAYEQLDHPVGPLMASWQETPCYVCGFSREYEYLSSVVVVNAETTELMVAMPLLGHEIGVSDFLEYQAPPFENAEISGVEWRIEPGGPAWDLPFPEDRR